MNLSSDIYEKVSDTFIRLYNEKNNNNYLQVVLMIGVLTSNISIVTKALDLGADPSEEVTYISMYILKSLGFDMNIERPVLDSGPESRMHSPSAGPKDSPGPDAEHNSVKAIIP